MTTFKHLRIVLLFCTVLPFFSCGSDSPEAANTTDTTSETPAAGDASDASITPLSQESPVLPGAESTPVPSSTPATAPATAGGVQHYTCPKNCKGSGGPSAGKCPVCGSEYVHNQAFHAQQGNSPTPTTTTPVPNPTATPAPSQAKNAAGVYHYTCPKGCSGGAASAGKCSSCGGDLAHNAAFHQ